MKNRMRFTDSVSTTLPKSVKKEILKLVEKGDYKSVSDFLRTAVYRSIEERSKEQGDILREESLRRFIEKIS